MEIEWLNRLLIHLNYIGIGGIIILGFLILRKFAIDIKIMDKRSKKRIIDYMKKTSKYTPK